MIGRRRYTYRISTARIFYSTFGISYQTGDPWNGCESCHIYFPSTY